MRAVRFVSSVSRRPKRPFSSSLPRCVQATTAADSSASWERQTLFARQSSSLATVEDNGLDEGRLVYDEAATIATKSSRLEALRETLKSENAVATGALQTPTDPTAVWQTNKRRTAKVSTVVSSSSDTESESEQVTDYRALAASLPDISNELLLTDRFARKHSYLRISLTERCNLRCTYCMPEDGVPLQAPDKLLQTPEILQLAESFAAAGVRKFRLTGGEPTLRRDLVDVVAGLKALNPSLIGMTTNGITVAKQLPDLVQAGLSSMNLSLDSLQPDKFAALTRRPATYLDRVWQALEMAVNDFGEVALSDNNMNSPSLVTKVNCVVQRDVNTDEIADFVRLTHQFPGLQVRFIEYMPFSDNGWKTEKLVPYQELLTNLELQDGIVLQPEPSADPHDTTKWFRTDQGGKIGFITSMSSHFCAGCNRLRLGADGQIKVCLFDGKTEISLRDAVRQGLTQPEILKLVWSAVQKKQYALGGHKDAEHISQDAANNKPMTLIGG